MTKKDKLEASLDALFSDPEERPPAPTSEPEAVVEAAPPEAAVPDEAVVKEENTIEAAPAEDEADAPPVEDETGAEDAAVTPEPPAPKAPDADAAEETQVVVFRLADEFYGVDIFAVESVIEMQPITVVPRTRAFIRGLTNLRGTVIPVIDLRVRCGLPERAESRATRIVVVNVEDTTAGLVVDAVTEVLPIPETVIEPPSPLVTSVDAAFIRGIAKVDERLIVLMELDEVLQFEALNVSGVHELI